MSCILYVCMLYYYTVNIPVVISQDVAVIVVVFVVDINRSVSSCYPHQHHVHYHPYLTFSSSQHNLAVVVVKKHHMPIARVDARPLYWNVARRGAELI